MENKEPEIKVRAIPHGTWVDIRQGEIHVEFIMDDKCPDVLKKKLSGIPHESN